MLTRPRATALVLVLMLSTAGCDAGPGETTAGATEPASQSTLPPAGVPSTDPASTEPAASTDPAGAGPAASTGVPSADAATTAAVPTPQPGAADPDPAAVDLSLEEVAILDAPTAMAVRSGDDRLYVAEREGRVRPIAPDGTVGEPVLDISDSTTTGGERGLLGIAWAPAGDRLFVSSTDTDGATLLEAVDVVDGALQATSRVELLRVPQPASNHNGGNIAFGPDGMLYLGLGDGGGADDQFGQAQRPDTLLGSMLRLDVEGADVGDGGYAIPADNPFADGGAGAPEVWAYGLRNPWRFSFDAGTGQLWIADVGQNAVEEINRVDALRPGLNYGWPRFEGDRPFDGQPAEGPLVEPVSTYTHQRGCSITGGHVYRGQAIPALHGAYVYSDYCNGEIFALDLAADGTVVDDVAMGVSTTTPVSFGEGPDGELYVLSIEGPIHRLVEG